MAEKTKSKASKLADVESTTSKVDYAHLTSLMENDVQLFAIKNTVNTPLILDWNLELLPSDLEDEFNKYLEKKYLEYGKENLIGGARIVSIFENGKTINFLNSFLTNKKFPVVLPRPVGREDEFRSSFVLNAGDAVILTQAQAESLRRFEKLKRVWEEENKKIESPWLGFLVFTPIQDSKDLLKYSISYVTSKDTINTAQDIKVTKARSSDEVAGIIRAKE